MKNRNDGWKEIIKKSEEVSRKALSLLESLPMSYDEIPFDGSVNPDDVGEQDDELRHSGVWM